MSIVAMSPKVLQDGDEFTFRDDYSPKERKPYTIMKRRERWTGDEHQKFIEALKLYGRAWKRIEEHVGTKTTVQIRSHAQKFFTKVFRESSSGEANSVKPDEIPPPRPKRKPVHPYPRKVALSSQNIDPTAEKPVMFASMTPSLSVLEKENQSRSPVLSGVDTSEDDGLSRDGSVNASSSRSLKLFGKTMVVTDSHTESTATVDFCKAEAIVVTYGSPVETLNLNMIPDKYYKEELDCSLGENSCSTSFPFQNDSSRSGSPFTLVRVYSPVPIKPCSFMPNNRELQDREFMKEGSSSGSDIESICLEIDEDRKSEAGAQSLEILVTRDREHKHFSSRSGKTGILKHKMSINGFVPYKRCVADKGFLPYSSMVSEERIEQTIRLSL